MIKKIGMTPSIVLTISLLANVDELSSMSPEIRGIPTLTATIVAMTMPTVDWTNLPVSIIPPPSIPALELHDSHGTNQNGYDQEHGQDVEDRVDNLVVLN